MSVRQRMAEISQGWFLLEPLLFAVWTTHDLVSAPRLTSIRVGRGRIEYNPTFLEALSPRRLETVMRCEALRILLKHPYQRRKPDPARAYLASNLTLQEALLTELPWPRARDLFGSDQYDHQYFEFYYRLLGETGAQPAAAAGFGPATDAESGVENTEGWDADDLFSDRLDTLVRDAQESGGWGSVGGTLRELVLANLTPELDYRSILAHFRKSVLSTQRRLTRMKPNRRYGFQCQGSRYEFATSLLLAVDVSGSISNADLVNGFSLVNQFFRYGIRRLDVISFDTEVRDKPLTLTRARHRLQVTGRGGTDLSAALDYIDQHPNYDGLIIFTDGIAPVPPPPRNRRTRVLWIFNSSSTYRQRSKGLRAIGPALYLKPSPLTSGFGPYSGR